jgi:hypothetical protein
VVSTGFGGVASSADGCAFTPWLPSEQPFIADIRVRAGQSSSVVALEASADGASFVNRLWESTDDAATWQQLGAPFAATEQATSHAMDSDGDVFVGTSGPAGAALLRFDAKASPIDRVPLTEDAGARPRVVGVSGSGAAARVYVVLDYEQVEGLTTHGDVALLSVDGGSSFSPLLTSIGDLPAMALSADGKRLALGGEEDGIQLLDAADAATAEAPLVKVSELEAHALAWDGDGRLYAAGHEAEDGFAVGVSVDGGRTFESLFALCQVQGPLACAADTSVGAQCLATGETGWDVRKEVADSHACDTAQAGAANGASTPPDAEGTPVTAAPGSSAVSSSGAGDAGGCNLGGVSGSAAPAALLVLLVPLLRRCRSSGAEKRPRRDRPGRNLRTQRRRACSRL